MGYLMKEVDDLAVTPALKEVLLHLAQVIEDTESKVDSVPEDSDMPEETSGPQ